MLRSAPTTTSDLDVASVVLDVVDPKVRGLDTQIAASIIDGSIERTIDGASTLTLVVHDPDRYLLRSGIFDKAIDVQLDTLVFRLVQIGKQDDSLTLTFEDREVAYLRENYSPKKVNRSGITRAEFALSLVREVKKGGGINFVCPELHVRQGVTAADFGEHGRTDETRATNRERGINREAVLYVKEARADIGQLRLGERILDVADDLNAGPRATLALIEACIVESLIRNLSGGDADSRGVLQVRDSTARPMGIDNRNPAECASAFLRRGFTGRGGAIALARANPHMTAGQIAQAVQGSRYPTRYDERASEASAWLDAYSGVRANTPTSQTKLLPFEFRRGGTDGSRENSWTTLQRLAADVNWRCFMSEGSLYFISETKLIQAKPKLRLSEGTLSVLGIDFDLDGGKLAHEATITARADRWVASPGAVVELFDCGPADGRWLVATITRGIYDANATITIRRPSKPMLEPANETETTTFTPGEIATGTPKSIIDKIAVPLAKKHGMTTGVSPSAIASANARHGATVSGGRSDHEGPPDVAWASDMSNGSAPTPQMDALAADLAHAFDIPWTGSGAASVSREGYRYQMLYRTYIGGNHFNHVHLGVKRV